MKTVSFFFTFVASVFAAAVPSSFSADQQYEDCGFPMRCGLLSDVDYPFWGVNKPDYCGLRGFQLFCKNETYLTLKLNNLSLRVMSFDLINNTIVVADESLFLGGCPDLSLNFSGSNQFKIHPQAPKIGLFKCPVSPLLVEPSSFTCEGSNVSTVTYYTFPPSDILGGRDRENCTKVGDVLGLVNIYEDYPLRQTLEEALEDGFSLSYSIRENESCRLCLNSGGICGSVPDSESFQCFCPDRPHVSTCHDESSTNNDLNKGGGRNVRVKVIIGATAAGIVLALVITALILRKVKTCCIGEQQLEELVPLKRYSYGQIKKITNSFAREVGKGGFGIVYGGTLHDGCKVAVKILKESKGNNREDFINEVASMSRTSHVNIVTLLGFCYEGSKRAIIYEFLENGSLDKFISGKRSSDMDWSALYGIALGVARGLEYLHNGCRARIVHFDIKPQNVLLDDNLCPKVSDFGLAKLCEKKESILSLINARGTIGYIAPEVFSRMYGRVSYKSDVYSYGMLVLEMIGARNKTTNEGSASNTSEIYFPEWIYKDLEKADNGRLTENSFTWEQEEIAKKMRLVGLWCIQSFPSDRPPMNRVVEMMEGSVDAIEMPPRSVVSRPQASWLSEETSSLSGV